MRRSREATEPQQGQGGTGPDILSFPVRGREVRNRQPTRSRPRPRIGPQVKSPDRHWEKMAETPKRWPPSWKHAQSHSWARQCHPWDEARLRPLFGGGAEGSLLRVGALSTCTASHPWPGEWPRPSQNRIGCSGQSPSDGAD